MLVCGFKLFIAFLSFLVYLFRACLPQSAYERVRGQFTRPGALSTIWLQRINFRSSGLTASTFINWDILAAQNGVTLRKKNNNLKGILMHIINTIEHGLILKNIQRSKETIFMRWYMYKSEVHRWASGWEHIHNVILSAHCLISLKCFTLFFNDFHLPFDVSQTIPNLTLAKLWKKCNLSLTCIRPTKTSSHYTQFIILWF